MGSHFCFWGENGDRLAFLALRKIQTIQKRSIRVMKKVFTMKELEARYSGEWVLLINPKHIEQLERLRGELVFHSKDRSEVYKEAHKRKDAHTAIFYVGKLPEDLVVVL
jgi:hypothetical protein